MKVLNEKGKLFGLINIIDLGVLLIIAALIAGGLWYMGRKAPDTTVDTKDYYVTIKCPGYDIDVVNAINVGDRLYYDGGFINSEVTEVRTEPAKMDVATADGKIVVAQHPELKDIYVKVRVTDSLDDPMIYIGRLHANVGKDITLKTRHVEIPGKITKVEE